MTKEQKTVKIPCPKCKGLGGYSALVSQHDDERVYISCKNCYGTGYIHVMNLESEKEYHENNWHSFVGSR